MATRKDGRKGEALTRASTSSRTAVLRTLALAAWALAVAACGPPPLGAGFHDAATLRAELDEWRGPREGVVWLKRTVRVQVGSATDPRQAKSEIVHHVAKARLTALTKGDEVVELAIPAGARAAGVTARVLDAEGAREVAPLGSGAGWGPSVDPEGQALWTLRFAPLAAGQVLEVVASFGVPGTLVADARRLGAPDGPTGELFLEYRMAPHVNAAFQVLGKESRPMVATKDGQRVIALYEANLPAQETHEPYARYVTRTASPRNFKQSYAATWAEAAAELVGVLVTGSVALRQNHLAPMRPAGTPEEQAREVARWARDRAEAPDAAKHGAFEARSLPQALGSSGLWGAEKFHVLHWLLDEAGIPHALAVGRSAAYAPLDPAFPTPGAFEVPLVYVPRFKLWLDPECRSCEPGSVRQGLRGRQALVIGGAPVEVVDLPEESGKD